MSQPRLLMELQLCFTHANKSWLNSIVLQVDSDFFSQYKMHFISRNLLSKIFCWPELALVFNQSNSLVDMPAGWQWAVIHLNTIVITIISVSDLLDVWSQTPFHTIITPPEMDPFKARNKGNRTSEWPFWHGNKLPGLFTCVHERVTKVQQGP